MALDEAKKERLAKLRAEEAERQTREQEEADERELEALELTAALEGRGQKRGVDFVVINNRAGVFALKKPDTGAIRRWEAAKEKERLSLEWQIGFLGKYIVELDEQAVKAGRPPQGLTWQQTSQKFPGLCWQTANAFVDLMAVDRSETEKK